MTCDGRHICLTQFICGLTEVHGRMGRHPASYAGDPVFESRPRARIASFNASLQADDRIVPQNKPRPLRYGSLSVLYINDSYFNLTSRILS